jgi:hypothetical protein
MVKLRETPFSGKGTGLRPSGGAERRPCSTFAYLKQSLYGEQWDQGREIGWIRLGGSRMPGEGIWGSSSKYSFEVWDVERLPSTPNAKFDPSTKKKRQKKPNIQF